MSKHFFWGALLAVWLWSGPAAADPRGALSRAGAAYTAGDQIAALDALWEAQKEIWAAAPLAVRNVAFVTEAPKNFGDYRLKEGERFKNGENLILYCEPIGFTQAEDERGDHRFSLAGAFEILDARGLGLSGQNTLGPYERHGYRTFSTETMLVMTLKAEGLAAGDYVLRLTLRDNLAPGKFVELDKPFTIID